MNRKYVGKGERVVRNVLDGENGICKDPVVHGMFKEAKESCLSVNISESQGLKGRLWDETRKEAVHQDFEGHKAFSIGAVEKH